MPNLAIKLAISSILLSLACCLAQASTVLFVGNSFTYAANSPVRFYRHEAVTDLNGGEVGGVPALFASFASEAGVAEKVSLETAGGVGLDWHYANRAKLIDQPWDIVVMQTYSTLDEAKPGDPDVLLQATKNLAVLFVQQNPQVQIYLVSTWSRADQTYLPRGHWHGQSIDAMEKDIRAGYDQAAAECPSVKDVIPVGQAWNRAIVTGFADANPYDGIDAGKIDLWSFDNYHASMYGYYIDALVVFGDVTGLDPCSLGAGERTAEDLGISPSQATAMQKIAHDELALDGHITMKAFRYHVIAGP